MHNPANEQTNADENVTSTNRFLLHNASLQKNFFKIRQLTELYFNCQQTDNDG